MSPRREKPSKNPFRGNAPLVPGNPGNSGGKKGRSGRPAAPVVAFCRATLADPTVREGVLATARNPDAPAYSAVLRLLLAYGYGQPMQRVKVSGLAAIAARIEGLPDTDLQRLLSAPDRDLARLLPAGDENAADA